MVDLFALVTLVILSLAALVFAFQVIRQKRAGELSPYSFSTVLMVMLTGWMATEVVKDATGQTLGEFGRITHFAVMILFATTMTLQLRRSSESK